MNDIQTLSRTKDWAIDEIKGWISEALAKSTHGDGTYDKKNISRHGFVFETREGFEGFMRLLEVRDGKCLARRATTIAIAAGAPPALQVHYVRSGRNTHVLKLSL